MSLTVETMWLKHGLSSLFRYDHAICAVGNRNRLAFRTFKAIRRRAHVFLLVIEDECTEIRRETAAARPAIAYLVGAYQ